MLRVPRRLAQLRRLTLYAPPPREDVAAAEETHGKGVHVRVTPHTPVRSGEASRVANNLVWRVTVNSIGESDYSWTDHLMGWHGSDNPYSGGQRELDFPSEATACEYAARNGWIVDEVCLPHSAPILNRATIPGAPLQSRRPVTYEDNFSVRRGGIPQPTAVEEGQEPPYDA